MILRHCTASCLTMLHRRCRIAPTANIKTYSHLLLQTVIVSSTTGGCVVAKDNTRVKNEEVDRVRSRPKRCNTRHLPRGIVMSVRVDRVCDDSCRSSLQKPNQTYRCSFEIPFVHGKAGLVVLPAAYTYGLRGLHRSPGCTKHVILAA